MQKEKVSTVDTFANYIVRRWGLERTAQDVFPIERAGLLRRNSQSRAMLPAG